MTPEEQAQAAAKKAADKAAADKLKAEKAAADKAAAEEKAKEPKESDSDLEAEYSKFAQLKFAQFKDGTYSRKNLKDKALTQFDKLEKKIKAWKGHKPKESKTVYTGVEGGAIRIVEGYAVPKSLYEKFKSADLADEYFE